MTYGSGKADKPFIIGHVEEIANTFPAKKDTTIQINIIADQNFRSQFFS
jgi:hypothetical protein